MTATVTTWHQTKVWATRSPTGWFARCKSYGCPWTTLAFGHGAWQSAVDKALAHVDETGETRGTLVLS